MKWGATASVSSPALSSLVTKAVPPSKRATALSESQSAYWTGYASGSAVGGVIYTATSELGRLGPFAAAAALPVLMVAKPLLNYRKLQQRRKALDSIFMDSETAKECEPPIVQTVPSAA